jgi:adenylate cyclase class 2
MTSENNLSETELKLYVEDLAQVEARLRLLNATLKAPRVYERNIRYDDAAHRLSREFITLRLRQDTRARLTYKDGERQIGDLGTMRFEAEVEVSDFDTMHLILEKLGFTPALVYEKYRTTYALGEAEITLDEMPYGHFIEIEGTPDSIRLALAALALDSPLRMHHSYAVLFAWVKANLALPFRDLTFENFSGIDVPLSAFTPPRG